MNIYLMWGKATNVRAQVEKSYMNPFEGLEELEPSGAFVERILEPEQREGFRPLLMVKAPAEDSEGELELYYDYVAIPEPEETRIDRFKKRA